MDSTFCACLLLVFTTFILVRCNPHGSSCMSSDDCEVNTDCLNQNGNHYCLCSTNFDRISYGKIHCALGHYSETQNFGEDCREHECVFPYICDFDNRVDPKCICGTTKSLLINGTCVGRAYGEECENNRDPAGVLRYNDCMDPLTCNPDPGNATRFICGCPSATPIWNSTAMELSMICHGKYHDEDCQNTAECNPGLACNAQQKCTCEEPNNPNWNDEKKLCEGKYDQENCTGDPECLTDVLLCSDNGKCECPHSSPTWNPIAKDCGREIPFGGHCDTASECAPPSETCNEYNKCACLKNRTLDRQQNRCASKLRKTYRGGCMVKEGRCQLRGGCSKTSACMTEHGLSCMHGKHSLLYGSCLCTPPEQDWVRGNCRFIANLSNCRQSGSYNACDADIGQDLECGGGLSNNLPVCNCGGYKEYSLHARACKLKNKRPCGVSNVEEHDLCESQHCVKEIGEREARCACADKAEFKLIWSSEQQKCVENLYDMRCLPSYGSADCHYKGYNRNRTTLTCIDGRCKCEDTYTYYQGYCVFAHRIYDQDCDPTGIKPTCRVATHNLTTSLTCRDGKCACLPKEVTIDTDPFKKYVALTWNPNKGICDLKADGDACKEGAECHGGECLTAICSTKTKNGGNDLFGSLTHFMFIGPIFAIFKF